MFLENFSNSFYPSIRTNPSYPAFIKGGNALVIPLPSPVLATGLINLAVLRGVGGGQGGGFVYHTRVEMMYALASSLHRTCTDSSTASTPLEIESATFSVDIEGLSDEKYIGQFFEFKIGIDFLEQDSSSHNFGLIQSSDLIDIEVQDEIRFFLFSEMRK